VLRMTLRNDRRRRRQVLIAAVRTAAKCYFGLSEDRPPRKDIGDGFIAFNTDADYPCGVCETRRGVTSVGECNDCGLQCPCWIDVGALDRAPDFSVAVGDVVLPRPSAILGSAFNRTYTLWLARRTRTMVFTSIITEHFARPIREVLRDVPGEDRQRLVRAMVASASRMIFRNAEPPIQELPADVPVPETDGAYRCHACSLTFRMNEFAQCENCKLQCPSWIL